MTLLPTQEVRDLEGRSTVQGLLIRRYLEHERRPPAPHQTSPSARLLEPAPPTVGPVPDAVGAAMAFIDARAADPIGLTEIAAAAQLSPRAVQAAFRRHLGVTPLGHLRAVRMARVHADLQTSQPEDGATVSAVASRWGVTQLSRFARDYKQRYGVSPRQTLHRRLR